MAMILLVEDDGLLRGCLRKILELGAFQVEEASSVEEAIQIMSKTKVDLIVTDYLLSTKQNGLSLISYLSTLQRRPPIILMSGSDDCRLGSVCRELGAQTFLAKPFALNTFLAVCCQALI